MNEIPANLAQHLHNWKHVLEDISLGISVGRGFGVLKEPRHSENLKSQNILQYVYRGTRHAYSM